MKKIIDNIGLGYLLRKLRDLFAPKRKVYYITDENLRDWIENFSGEEVFQIEAKPGCTYIIESISAHNEYTTDITLIDPESEEEVIFIWEPGTIDGGIFSGTSDIEGMPCIGSWDDWKEGERTVISVQHGCAVYGHFKLNE